jgi:putative transposase
MSIRKRMERHDEPNGYRFITASCNKRLPLFAGPRIRDVFADSLAAAREKHGFELFAWVLMPNHFHLLLRPCKESDSRLTRPLGPMLMSIKGGVSQAVIPGMKRLNASVLPSITCSDGSVRFWQAGGGFDRNVRTMTEFTKEVWYIHTNPVRKGLVERAEDWKWSSVRWWMGVRDGEVECDPPPGKIDWEGWKGFK